MAKVRLNGELFNYDGTKQPMSEALAIEDAYGRRYAEWQADLQSGSAKAMAVLAWIIWRRDGRDVPFDDIIKGRVDFDLGEMLQSMAEGADDAQEDEKDAADPTTPGES